MTRGRSAAEHKGTRVGDRYLLGDVIGVGGFGAVYEARDETSGEVVAVKVLHPEMVQSREVVARFEREALAASHIGHPGIVSILSYGNDPLPWLAMERLRGPDLKAVLKAEGPWPLGRAVRLVSQLCDALSDAHFAEIIHRDLKPENVVVTEGERPVLVDFGVSKFLEVVDSASLVTRTGTAVGTPYYMSPEQAQGKKNIGIASDIYALGVILFEVLTGQRPFEDDSYPMLVVKICTEPPPPVSRYRADVPAAFDAIIRRCLEKEPSDRYASCADLAAALAPYASISESPRLVSAPRTSDSRAKVLGAAHTELAVDSFTGHPTRRELPEDVAGATEAVRRGGGWPWWVAGALFVAAVVAVTIFVMRAPPEMEAAEPVRLPTPGAPVVSPLSSPAPTQLGWVWENPRPRAMPAWRAVQSSGADLVAMVGPGGHAAKLLLDRGAQLQWWPTGVTADLNALAFIGPAQALAVGDEGTVVALLQSGARSVDVDTDADLHDVLATGPTDAVIVGARGTIIRLKSLRAERIDSHVEEHFFGVAASDDVVRAVGVNGRIARVERSGEVVSEHQSGPTLRAIAYCQGNWLAVGDHGVALRLVQNRWTRMSGLPREGLTDVTCDGDRFAASGADGNVFLLAQDRHVRLTSGTALGFRGIGGGTGAPTWLVGDGGRLARIERDHLRLLTAGPVATLYAVSDLAGALVVGGQWGTLARESATGLQALTTPTEAGIAALAKLQEHRLIAVGDGGELLEIAHDSLRRHALDADNRGVLFDVVAADGALLAVGASGALVRGAPGAFVVDRLPDVGALRGVAGDPSAAVAVGDEGIVLRVGATVATRIACPEGPTLHDVWEQPADASAAEGPVSSAGSGTFFAVGENGRILRIDGSGCVAEELATSADSIEGGQKLSAAHVALRAVGLGPSGRPFAVGANGFAAERSEEGQWRPKSMAVGGLHLYGLHATSRNVYVVGAGGLVLWHRRLDR